MSVARLCIRDIGVCVCVQQDGGAEQDSHACCPMRTAARRATSFPALVLVIICNVMTGALGGMSVGREGRVS